MDSDYQKTPLGWAKDKMLVPQIKKTLDSTDGRDYIFTISVQGHGDYPEVMPEGYNTSIKVSNFLIRRNRHSLNTMSIRCMRWTHLSVNL